MRHSVTIKCLKIDIKHSKGQSTRVIKVDKKHVYILNLAMIAKYSEHTDIGVNADQKYTKRRIELTCSMPTSYKYMPHDMCSQGPK